MALILALWPEGWNNLDTTFEQRKDALKDLFFVVFNNKVQL